MCYAGYVSKDDFIKVQWFSSISSPVYWTLAILLLLKECEVAPGSSLRVHKRGDKILGVMLAFFLSPDNVTSVNFQKVV